MDIDLKKYEEEKKEITDFLAKPEAFSSPDFAAKSRRLSEIDKILALSKEIDSLRENIELSKELLDENDAKMVAEVEGYEKEILKKQSELEELLLPHDPNDDKPAIVEIRAGAGGDEASLFAGELYRMYQHFAEGHGMKAELISQNENEAGGMKEVIFRLSGDRPYGQMKFEGGVHRVQRVPVT